MLFQNFLLSFLAIIHLVIKIMINDDDDDDDDDDDENDNDRAWRS